MNTTRSFGPVLVLAVTALGVLFGGPFVVRQLVYAQSEARIQLAAQNLANSRLTELSEAFRDVASVVEPSVVHVGILRKPSTEPRRVEVSPELREFFRRFGMPDDQLRERPDQPDDSQEFREFDPMTPTASGSGWIYDTEGHVVTNYHVIRDADAIEITLYDKTKHRAKVIGVDPNTDIAVLQIDAPNLHPAAIADHSPDQGEIVFAFGSPFGEQFSFSMSQGIVSGKGRRLGILGLSGYENFIQTDAAINRGNSGGPLVNTAGQVIGMNSAIATPSMGFAGVGFAIPVEMLQQYIPRLIESGKISRGYLGVSISDDPKVLKSFGVEHGVVVNDVLPESPAGKAGVQRGDVILEVEAHQVKDTSELRALIADFTPGTEVDLTVSRNGETQQITVTLGELPIEFAAELPAPEVQEDTDVDAAKMVFLSRLGIEGVVELRPLEAERLGLDPGTTGIIVGNVRAGSVAANEGLGRFDVITEVQGNPVATVDQLLAELVKQDLAKQGVRLTVLSRNPDGDWTSRFVVLQLGD